MKVEIRKAERKDIDTILMICREREFRAYTKLGLDKARDHLVYGLASSCEAWTGLIDDQIVCLWGVNEGALMSSSAFIWLVTAVGVNEHPFVFVRHSQIRLADLRKRYHYIHGVVQADNEVSIKWLRWLGFSIGPAENVNGYLVNPFGMAS